MKFYHSQKKKVRGWKRRVKQIDRWYDLMHIPYLTNCFNSKVPYVFDCYTVKPFYSAEQLNIPLWFFRLIIAKFVTAYSEWHKTFDNLDVPYDLQLWLYDPAYIRSEIICYKMQQHGEHKRFSWESDLSKPFPYEKLESKHYNLKDFEWTLADDEHIYFEDDFEDADFTVDDLLADGYIRKQQGDGLIYYAKRYGDIWIGRHKGAKSGNAKDVIQGYYAPPAV